MPQEKNGAMAGHWILAVTVLMILSACAPRTQQVQAQAGGEMRRLTLTHSGAHDAVDCGYAFPAEERTFVFELTNGTGENVRLKDIDRACKCITAAASFTHLAPNESGLVSVWINFLPTFGAESKTVIVSLTADSAQHGSEPAALACEITFSWNVQELLEEDASHIPSQPAAGGPPPAILVKRGKHPQAWDSFTVEDERKLFNTRIEPAASGWLIHLSAAGTIPAGGVSGLLKARFTEKGKALAHETSLPYFVSQ